MSYNEIREKLLTLDTSCMMDADGSIGQLDPAIKPVHDQPMKMIGRAYTVSCLDDFLTVVKALSEAKEGDILVVDGQGGRLALAGEIFTTEAKRKGLGGIIIDGACRDSKSIKNLNLPFYAKQTNPKAGATQKLGSINTPVECGGAIINPGDIIFGDMDGIIVAGEDLMAKTIVKAEEIQRNEEAVLNEINSGVSLFDLLNLDEHIVNVESSKESKLKFLLPR